jgi:hypothetical protein
METNQKEKSQKNVRNAYIKPMVTKHWAASVISGSETDTCSVYAHTVGYMCVSGLASDSGPYYH